MFWSASVLVLWNVSARAQEEPEIQVGSIEDYDAIFAEVEVISERENVDWIPSTGCPPLLDERGEPYDPSFGEGEDTGGGPNTGCPLPQLFEGVGNVIGPRGESGLGLPGETLTEHRPSSVAGDYTENWIVYRPETLLRGGVELGWIGPWSQGVSKWLAPWQKRPDAREYGQLTFVFDYQAPPTAQAIGLFPTVIPAWVTDVIEFSVTTEIGGQVEESGALYRERSLVNGEVIWRDVWVLWTNYKFPSAATGATTGLEVVSAPRETARAFLQRQATQPQWLWVHTQSKVTALVP